MLTTKTAGALIPGAPQLEKQKEKVSKMKLVSISKFPIGVKGKSIKQGEVFELDGADALMLLGHGKAKRYTEKPENAEPETDDKKKKK